MFKSMVTAMAIVSGAGMAVLAAVGTGMVSQQFTGAPTGVPYDPLHEYTPTEYWDHFGMPYPQPRIVHGNGEHISIGESFIIWDRWADDPGFINRNHPQNLAQQKAIRDMENLPIP